MLWRILLIILFVLIAHISVIVYVRSRGAEQRQQTSWGDSMKIVIDTDAGGDDAVALLLALAAKEVQVIAVTCVYGNTRLDNVEDNVLKTLTIAKRPDIPVYSGAGKPLLENYTAGDYFGDDGFGDFDFGESITGSVDRSKHASIAMIELAKKYPGELNILTLGPLTNVALAASLDPSFTRNVRRFHVMGSWLNDDGGEPSEPEVEFNFGLDPESNAIFLNSTTKRRSLVAPWDVARKCSIPKDWRTQILGKLGSERIEFLNKVERVTLARSTDWYAADSIAAAAMIWPDLVTVSSECSMRAVVHGPARGSVSLGNCDNVAGNVEIVRDFNVSAFKNKLLEHFA